MTPIEPLFPPLAADFKSGPKNRGGAGAGGNPGQEVPAAGATGTRGTNKANPAAGDDLPSPKGNESAPDPAVNPDDVESEKNLKSNLRKRQRR